MTSRTILRNVRPFDRTNHDEPTPIDVAIENGRISEIGPKYQLASGQQEFEMSGRWLLPAFCDSHIHLHTLAQQQRVLKLARDTTPEILRDRLGGDQSQGWLVAQGWQDPLEEQLQPNPRLFLDEVSPRQPIWAFAYDHHRAVLNSAALREVGYNPEQSDGVLLEDEMMEAWGRVPELDADLPLTIQALHRHGIAAATSFDGTAAREIWRKHIGSTKQTVLRVRHSIPVEEFMAKAGSGGLLSDPVNREDAFCVPWVKVFLDGTLGSRTAWLKEPYCDQGGIGEERIRPEERARIARAIAKSGFGVCLHAIGDAAVLAAQQFIETVQLNRSGDRQVLDRIEHAQLIDLGDLSRISAAKTLVSMQPCHLLEDAAIAPERWGDRCQGAFAARAVLEAGIPLIFGSDAPIETFDPWVDIGAAVDRIDREGVYSQGWVVAQALTFQEAFSARTSAAGVGNYLPNGWGVLEVGSPADLQVLECEHPTKVRNITEARLQELWIAGDPVGLSGSDYR